MKYSRVRYLLQYQSSPQKGLRQVPVNGFINHAMYVSEVCIERRRLGLFLLRATHQVYGRPEGKHGFHGEWCRNHMLADLGLLEWVVRHDAASCQGVAHGRTAVEGRAQILLAVVHAPQWSAEQRFDMHMKWLSLRRAAILGASTGKGMTLGDDGDTVFP